MDSNPSQQASGIDESKIVWKNLTPDEIFSYETVLNGLKKEAFEQTNPKLSKVELDKQYREYVETHYKLDQTKQNVDKYNCLAWSFGKSYQFCEPYSDLASNLKVYESLGYVKCDKTDKDVCIDWWTKKVGPNPTDIKFTHASRFYKGNWTSKLGNRPLLRHDREGIAGSVYGDIYCSWKLSGKQASYQLQIISDENLKAVQQINRDLKVYFPDLVAWFQRLWEQYEVEAFETKGNPDYSPLYYQVSMAANSLKTNGLSVVSLFIEKMYDATNWFAVSLVNEKILTSDDIRITKATDPTTYMLKADLAQAVVARYGAAIAQASTMIPGMVSANGVDRKKLANYGMKEWMIPLLMVHYAAEAKAQVETAYRDYISSAYARLLNEASGKPDRNWSFGQCEDWFLGKAEKKK